MILLVDPAIYGDEASVFTMMEDDGSLVSSLKTASLTMRGICNQVVGMHTPGKKLTVNVYSYGLGAAIVEELRHCGVSAVEIHGRSDKRPKNTIGLGVIGMAKIWLGRNRPRRS